MKIGIDFDNTIICYHEVFHKLALEKKLISADLPVNKTAVRDYLRNTGKNDLWTELQGYVYGKRMSDAKIFEGVKDFFYALKRNNIPFVIISHKTKFPYKGPEYDLHQQANQWLTDHGFFNPNQIGMKEDQIFFKLTKQDKLLCIAENKCTHFIDDLPEFLTEKQFPQKVKPILFDPDNNYPTIENMVKFAFWKDILLYFNFIN